MNTIRVVTLICADDSVRIMAAVLRLSRKGKFADNFHHDGIASLIDVETGIVNTTGVDRKWNRYTIHPDSRKPIVGFQIPRWFEVVDMVKKAARVHPEVRYVGWDVTIKSSGEIVLIIPYNSISQITKAHTMAIFQPDPLFVSHLDQPQDFLLSERFLHCFLLLKNCLRNLIMW